MRTRSFPLGLSTRTRSTDVNFLCGTVGGPTLEPLANRWIQIRLRFDFVPTEARPLHAVSNETKVSIK
jgi:hypothetical protein